MKNIVCVFPGQGSQYIGMGKEQSQHPYFSQASDVLNFDLKDICLNGPEEKLTLTQNTQPAIVTHSLILFDKLLSQNIRPNMVLGHSVGEYSALVAAQSLDFKDAVLAVHKRGQFMQSAVPSGEGGMTAILKAEDDIVNNVCQEVSTKQEFCSVANFNSPGQIVISGHLGALEKAVIRLKEKEVKFRAVNLAVSAPFHCALMEKAASKLKIHLDSIKIQQTALPYVANIDAKEYPLGTQGPIIKDNLVKQVSGSVLWTQSLALIPKDSLVIEVGPGKVLKGLVKKTRPDLEVYSLDTDGFDFIKDL